MILRNSLTKKEKAMKTLRCRNLIVTLVALATFVALPAEAQEVLPRPEQPFGGRIGITAQDSVKDFPKEVAAPKGAPNILLILTDDVGFGASSTFGGPIPTATMDRLAKAGLRYTNFHTTALCSPTRAALLTGRNHHSASDRRHHGSRHRLPRLQHARCRRAAGTFAEVLKQNGYNTAWYGKNHNVPDWHGSQAGPFDLWPTGLGFEYFYGFIGGDTNQWNPALVGEHQAHRAAARREGLLLRQGHGRPRHRADPHAALGRPAKAVAALLRARHGPRAASRAARSGSRSSRASSTRAGTRCARRRSRGRRQLGIVPPNTKLTERSAGHSRWDSLDADQKKVFAHMMEVYAARAVALPITRWAASSTRSRRLGELDNTLVIYIQGDNGASAEGGPQGLLNEMTFFNGIPEDFAEVLRRMDELGGPNTFNHYPIGWAHAMDTPFQWTKQVASHFGGTRNGLVISWPARIKDKGGIRTQFHHVIDITPTILEAVGVQSPSVLNGVPQKADRRREHGLHV